jgi:hypothetical protein
MLSPRATGLITLCLLLSCRIVFGTDPSQVTAPSIAPPLPNATSPTPGTAGPTDIGNTPGTPAMLALPEQSSGPTNSQISGPVDASNLHKFYTYSVALRETYDDNVGTTSTNKQTALETEISPGVVVNFPMENTQFSAGYSFDATYYTQTAGTGNNLQYSHRFNAQLSHDFSSRFSLNMGDSLIDSPEPNLYGTTGTPYRDGQNVSNSFTAGLSAQWTPLFGTSTTYSNTIVRYLDSGDIAAQQDSMENTASETCSFTIVPTFSVSFGGIFDTVEYDQDLRGYTSLTGFIGGTWETLPNVTLSLRVGGSYTETDQLLADGSTASATQVAPYVDLSGSWQIGERSSLTADYSHETTPSDYFGSNAQESDRVSGNFNYQINPLLSTHFQLSYTYSVVSGADIYLTSSTNSYTETVYAADLGASYNFIKYFSVSLDISESGVSSGASSSGVSGSSLDYNREEVSMGVRGTY